MAEANGASTVRRTGAIARHDGSVSWRVWAPRAKQVTLVLLDDKGRREVPMEPEPRGYHHCRQHHAAEGQLYRFRLEDGPELPDPCSLSQPEGVFGPSAVVAPDRFAWSDAAWRGIARADLVFYEIHVGAFTPQGTFEAIIPRLPALAELGITAVQIMPVGQFSGARGWGYDGVFPYAAHDAYGGPRGLERLVDACHRQGLAIFLDVVFNHFGPEGNVFEQFGPYFNDRYKTPWGAAINYDSAGCDAVRDFVLDNVRMWLEEFHFDGLRIDAADTMFDLGARHILAAIKTAADDAGRRRGWPAFVTAETDLDDPRLLYSVDRGGYALDQQWMDDYHHAIHAFLTGERTGYYVDFGDVLQIAQVLEQPYVYHWDYSSYRDRRHGAAAEGLSGDRFVIFVQNHDQIGNRARGERLLELLGSQPKVRLAASLLLLSPYIPLLFMGEEYGEENRFPYFCSFQDPELIEGVRAGRKQQFGDLMDPAQVPDPVAESTFEAARLTWSWPDGTFHSSLRRLYHDLLELRRRQPALRDFENRKAQVWSQPQGGVLLELIRGAGSTGRVRVLFNLGNDGATVPERPEFGSAIAFSSESPVYLGARRTRDGAVALLPWECVVFMSIESH